MLLLLALKGLRNRDRIPTPCWEIKNCPAEWKENCLVWKLKARHFCWFINGTYCQGHIQQSWDKKIQLCRTCEVFQTMTPPVK
ncbi:MAG: two-CW domain-containing protein [Candidatus Sifarchaeia archaeon]